MQLDSHEKQDHAELMGNLKAEEQDEAVLKTLESLRNTQTMEPEAPASDPLGNCSPSRWGLMQAGWSQVAR